MALRILFVPFGSEGDVNPLFSLADLLAARGHEVIFLLTPHYRAQAERRGFRWIPMGTEEDFRRIAQDPHLWDRLRGPHTVVRNMVATLPAYGKAFAKIADPIDLVITSSFALGATALAEAAGIPRLTLHLQPVCLRSTFDCPLFVHELAWLRKAPRPVIGLAFNLIDFVFWRMVKKPLNRFRAELGLVPWRNFFGDALHSAEGVAALFPPWFAAPQSDWPPHLRQFGFPPVPAPEPLAPHLAEFFSAGPPPVIWTHGSANFDVASFQRQAIETSTRLGLRSLLVSLAPPEFPLSDDCFHVAHVRFEDVFPQAAAVVHHGGIGTMSKAIAAGLPQLIIPRSHDQPDNARRVVELGLGATLPFRSHGHAKLDRTLRDLLSSATVKARCQEYQTRMASENDWAALTAWAEDLARHGVGSDSKQVPRRNCPNRREVT